MSDLASKVQVLRGWAPGSDSSVDQSLTPATSGGSLVTLDPGLLVIMDSTGVVDVATSPADTTVGTALIPAGLYLVVEGNGADTSGQFVEKVVGIRGRVTVKTDKLDAGQSFPVGGHITYSAGLLQDCGGTSKKHDIGVVIANDVSTDGTITVEMDLR